LCGIRLGSGYGGGVMSPIAITGEAAEHNTTLSVVQGTV
jgi:hypothetical protein